LYNPEADVSAAISHGIAEAKANNKPLLLQISANWYPWCIKFLNFYSKDQVICTLIDNNYVIIKLYCSKENRNLGEFKKLEYPQRLGFPVFVILDSNGKRIHAQISAYLEESDGYSKTRIPDFLSQWCPESLNPNL